jgi:hypothetical protein
VAGRYGTPGGDTYRRFGVRRGTFQYGLLQVGFGQTFGSFAGFRGIHWCPHRSHFQAQVVIFTLAMRLV